MIKNLTLPVIAGAVALGVAFGGQAVAQQVTLKLHSFLPPPSNPVKTFLKPWISKVAKASKGTLKVQYYPSMQLGGKPPQLADQVKDGVVDMIYTLPGYTAGRFPMLEVFELPFIHKNALSTALAIQDYQAKHLKNEFKDYHVILLHNHAGSMFMTKKVKIRKVSDLKGLKIRTATRAGGWYLKSLGAVPIGAPLPKIPQMLSKGVIEGAMLPFEIAPAIKMQELASNFIQLAGDQPRMNTSTFAFLMNKNSYKKLSNAHKKVIDQFSGKNIAKWAGQNWDDIEAPGEKVMRSKKKNSFLTIPAGEVAKMKEAAKPAIARWIKIMKKKGIDGDQLISDARAMIAKYNK